MLQSVKEKVSDILTRCGQDPNNVAMPTAEGGGGAATFERIAELEEEIEALQAKVRQHKSGEEQASPRPNRATRVETSRGKLRWP